MSTAESLRMSSWPSTRVVVACTFVVALAIRLAIVAASPHVNTENTDLEMYRMGGVLVASGVDPFDPRDHIALRAELRHQTRSATFKITQGFWDYAAGSLL